jgi:molecular chaperone DnaJ
MSLKMNGYGEAGAAGGPPGDLFVAVTVEPHPLFKRQGDDVTLDLPVTFTEAALGCHKDLPTPLGDTVKIAIPEGSQNGRILRVSGKGISNIHGRGRGDLLIRLNIETPTRLTEKQKTLLHSFQETETAQNHPQKKSFFEKLQDFFH